VQHKENAQAEPKLMHWGARTSDDTQHASVLDQECASPRLFSWADSVQVHDPSRVGAAAWQQLLDLSQRGASAIAAPRACAIPRLHLDSLGGHTTFNRYQQAVVLSLGNGLVFTSPGCHETDSLAA
jgi:hypothetical protein